MSEETHSRFTASLAQLNTIEKLKGTVNYPLWAQDMRDILEMLDLWVYVIDPVLSVEPTGENAAEKIPGWKQKQSKICVMIKSRCEATPRAKVSDCTTASSMWNTLAKYKPKGSGILNSTYRKLETLTLASCDNDVSTYSDRFTVILTELDNLTPGLSARFDENWKIYRFHSGLGPSYSAYYEHYNQSHDAFDKDGTAKYSLDHAITRFLNTVSNPSDATSNHTLVAHAHTQHTQQSVHALVSTAVGTAKLEHKIQDGCTPSNSRTYSQTCKVCSHCSRDWHDISECRDLGKGSNKRPADDSRGGRRGGGRGGGNGNKKPRKDKDDKPKDSQPAPAAAGVAFNFGLVSTAFTVNQRVGKDNSHALISAAAAMGAVWIFDSGCTQHITRDRSAFETYASFINKDNTVNGMNGSCVAEGFGRIKLECRTRGGAKKTLSIDNVWYVPNSGFNLISQGQLEDQGCPISIVKGGMSVNNGIIFRRQSNRLYILDTWQTTPVCLAAINMKPDLSAVSALSEATDQANGGSSPGDAEQPLRQTKASINEETLRVWHSRLGHLGRQNVIRLAQMSEGMDLTADPPTDACEPCVMGNMKVQAHTGHIAPGRWQNDLIWSDVQGPFPSSYDNMVYLVTFLDDKTLRSATLPIPDKSGPTVLNVFKAYAYTVEHDDCKITRLRTDCGGEYDNNGMLAYRQSKGIVWEATVPDNPQMNGKSERLGQTIQQLASAMLKDSGFDEKYWSQLVRTANYLRNRQPVTGREVTPFEAATGHKPKLSHLRRVGQTGLCQVRKGPQQSWKKNQDHATLGRLLGYEGDHGYIMLDSKTQKVKTYANVRWIDEKPPELSSQPDHSAQNAQNKRQAEPLAPIPPPKRAKPPQPQSSGSGGNGQQPSDEDLAIEFLNAMPPAATAPEPAQEHRIIELSPSPEPVAHRPTTRSMAARPQTPPQRPLPLPHEIQRSHPELSPDPLALATLNAQANIVLALLSKAKSPEPYEPQTYAQAMADAERKMEWQLGMQDEIDSLVANGTWTLMDLPSNHRALGGKWVYKFKRGPAGEIVRYKARWVVRGFEQREGIDFNETFASVVKPMSYKAVFALAAALDWELEQMDVKTAFLYGKVQEEVYIVQPKGFEDGTRRVCKLNKALYGLKQSPRVWYNTMSAYLKELGFEPLATDLSVFTNGKTIIAVYVDDILLAGPDKGDITRIKAELHRKFEMTDLGPCAYYLGMTVTRDRANRIIRLSQTGYMEKFIREHGMWESAPTPTPMGSERHLPAEDDYQCTDAFRTQYQSAVGSLMYAMLGTRPDIAFAVSVVSRYGSKPTEEHWKAVKRIFRYLKSTINMQLVYRGDLQALVGWTDADWAGDHDTRRSTSGYIFSVGSGALSWSSKRQPTVALSTCEAEYIGQTQATKEAIWLRNLLSELNPDETSPHAVIIYGDNQGAIALAKNPEFHARSKHMAIQTAFVREQVANGSVDIKYTPTGQQVADGLTKALCKDLFIKFRSAIGLESPP